MIAKVDFTEVSKQYCSFSSTNLKIFIMDGNKIVEEIDYNSVNVERLSKEMPVIFSPDTSKCSEMPKEYLLLGRLRIK